MIDNYYLLEYPLNEEYELKIDNKNKKFGELKIFKSYSENKKKINKIKNSDLDAKNKISKLEKDVRNTKKINGELYDKFLFNLINESIGIYPNSLEFKDINIFDFYKLKEKISLKKNEKFKKISFLMFGEEIYKIMHKLDYCTREEKLFNLKISALIKLLDVLELGGMYISTILDYCSMRTINLVYLMSLLFEKILIINGEYIVGYGYLGEKRIKKENLEKLYDNNFDIEPKVNYDNLIKYLKNYFTYLNDIMNDLLKNKTKDYINKNFEDAINGIIQKDVNSKYLKEMMYNFENNFQIKKDNKWLYKMIEENKKDFCKVLQKLIKDNSIQNCLEIGFGLGVISNCILNSRKDLLLLSIDNQQKEMWNNDGIKFIKNKDRFNLYEERFIESIVEIKNKYGEQYFDLALIDRCESFERMLLEVFFIKKLLRMNGYLVFDNMYSISYFKIIDYIDNNFKDLEKIENKNYNIYKKISDRQTNCNEFYYF